MTPHVAAGSYGQVYKGTLQLENNTEIEVAVKVLKSKIEKDFKEFRSEIEILKKLNHPNIVKFYNSGEWQGSLYFVIEWCPGGSLESLMLKKKGPFSEEEARVLFKSLAQGLQYVHD
jgi:calcium-dependent protein kinase